ncbi:SIS domain-containing protein [Anoxybacteroides tepidamans]|uniref:SIS domain-containing protein n=1 Tax=Anoxybacteroides tepidamans TaxID=265948 RepID=UPI00048007B0|nr:SIS domain-containing protein [Anoxybacillus tepidamans]
MLGKKYAQLIQQQLQLVEETQWESITKAARMIALSIKEGGLLHIFGCGHSHMLAEEVFYRAGGLVPINPILEPSVMLHEGAVKSSMIERMPGYASIILNQYTIQSNEVMIIASNSGVNVLPIEMAMEAVKKGLKVIAITSSAYSQAPSRHPSGKKLYELAHIVIDSQLPYGDALVEIPRLDIKTAPGSTVVGAFILNMLIAEVVEELIRFNIAPPIFMSGNVEGGFEHNRNYIEQYRLRIKHL